MKVKDWRICVFNPERKEWMVLNEGPWDTEADAKQFAEAEVGWKWTVVPLMTGKP
jgi:hypothetical protein